MNEDFRELSQGPDPVGKAGAVSEVQTPEGEAAIRMLTERKMDAHEELIWGAVFTALTHRVTLIAVVSAEADFAVLGLRQRPVSGDLTPSEKQLWASIYGTYLASCDLEAAHGSPQRLTFVRNCAATYAEKAIETLRARR